MRGPIETPDFDALRAAMVREQITARGVESARVLDAMRRVPREDYVPPQLRLSCCDDRALAIGEGQTISQPFVTAYLLDALEVRAGDRALEVGTGSGYGAALLGELAAQVHTIERIEALATAARQRLRAAGYDHVHVHCTDGSLGLPEETPFDVIAVTAGSPEVPPSLQQQLAPRGRLVLPVGPRGRQTLVRVRRLGLDRFSYEKLTAVRFVPLIGKEGWRPDAD